MDEPSSLANQLLIAMPGMEDPNFSNTVTLICEHNADGALGIIINRPLSLNMGGLFRQLSIDVSNPIIADEPVVMGGPVGPERGFVLHGGDRTFESSHHLTDNLYLSTAIDVLDAIAQNTGPEDYLVALGYAGWGAGQLEDEMGRNVWLSAPADPAVLFHTPFTERLHVAAEPLGIDFRLIAGRPGHA